MTGRWVMPKGNRMPGLTAQEAAEHEAFEEAGIAGMVLPRTIGSYRYSKQQKNGSFRSLDVDVFPMAFGSQFDSWPERNQRQTRWCSLDEAINAVNEAELKIIFAKLARSIPTPLRAMISV